MTQHSHQTAPPQFVDAVFGFLRRFDKSGGAPLVFKNAFTGTVDVPIQKDTDHD
jgi:hypothetical protein